MDQSSITTIVYVTTKIQRGQIGTIVSFLLIGGIICNNLSLYFGRYTAPWIKEPYKATNSGKFITGSSDKRRLIYADKTRKYISKAKDACQNLGP